jgi:hypothetical protein
MPSVVPWQKTPSFASLHLFFFSLISLPTSFGWVHHPFGVIALCLQATGEFSANDSVSLCNAAGKA